MNLKIFVTILVIAALLSIVSTMLFYSFYIIEEVTIRDMYLIIGNRTGFDTSKDKIAFGMITPRSSCTREMIIENKKEYPLKLNIKISGNISDYVTVSYDNDTLAPHEKKKISFIAEAPADAKLGTYNGSAKFILKRIK